jgi:hypothetical protein
VLRGSAFAALLGAAALLAPVAVAASRPSAAPAHISLNKVSVVRRSDGVSVKLVHRGRSASFRAQYTITGGSGTGQLVMRIHQGAWLFTISSHPQHVHPGVWRFAANAAIPARFPAATYTLTTTVTLRKGSKTVATAEGRRSLHVD